MHVHQATYPSRGYFITHINMDILEDTALSEKNHTQNTNPDLTFMWKSKEYVNLTAENRTEVAKDETGQANKMGFCFTQAGWNFYLLYKIITITTNNV